MNYVLFFPDEMRASGLGCYGNPMAKTPNYDRLAAEGTLFENHYVQNPVCVGSRCSLLTGWYPHVAGHRSLLNFLKPHEPNFLRYMKEAGYDVRLYGKNHVLDADALALSVTEFDGCDKREASGSIWRDTEETRKIFAKRMFSGNYTMLFPPMDDEEFDEIVDTKIVNRSVKFLDERKADAPPFFLFVSINNPHASYVTSKYYDSLYDPDQFAILKKELKDQPAFMRLLKQYSNFDTVDDETFRKCASVYLGMITYCDDMLGRILDALDRNGLSDDTMVITTSDHGDFAGDYGLIEKWPNAFYDNLTKTPLIMRAPGAARGHRVKELVSEIDIMPTVLDYAGVDIRHDQFGHSLRAQLAGAPGDPDAAVFSEGGYDLREPQCFEGTERDYSFLLNEKCVYYPKMMIQQHEGECVCRGTMMRKGNHKLIWRSNGEHEFFDLEKDPGELVNEYTNGDYAAIILNMEKEMLMWYIKTADSVPHLE